jgi:hypothetical protein
MLVWIIIIIIIIVIIAIIYCCYRKHEKYQRKLRERTILNLNRTSRRDISPQHSPHPGPIRTAGCRYVNASGPISMITGIQENFVFVYTTEADRLKPVPYRYGKLRDYSSIMIIGTGTEFDNQIFPLARTMSVENGVWIVDVTPLEGAIDYSHLNGTYFILDAPYSVSEEDENY